MTDCQLAVKTVFEKSWNKIKEEKLPSLLSGLHFIIPNINYIYQKYDRRGIEIAARLGIDAEAKGLTLYTVADDSDIVHWIAINKKREKTLEIFFRVVFDLNLESFKAADLERQLE